MHTYSPSQAESGLTASEVLDDQQRKRQPVEGADPDLLRMAEELRVEFERTRGKLDARIARLEARSISAASATSEVGQ